MKKPKTNPKSLVFAQFWLKQFPELVQASVLPVVGYKKQIDSIVLRRQSTRGSYSQVRLTLDYDDRVMAGHCSMYDHRGQCVFVGAVFHIYGMKDMANKLYERGFIDSKEFKNL